MTVEANNREAQLRLRRRKSIAIAAILGLLVTLFYAVTIVRLKGNVTKRAQQQTSGFSKGMPAAPSTEAGAKSE